MTVPSDPELKWVQRGKVRGQKGLTADSVVSWHPGSLGLAGMCRCFLFAWGTSVGSWEMLPVCWERLSRGSPDATAYGSALARGGRGRGAVLQLLALPLKNQQSISYDFHCGLLSPPRTWLGQDLK